MGRVREFYEGDGKMMVIDKRLAEREALGRPIRVGMLGAGEMAAGLTNQIERHVPGMRMAAIYNRTVSKAQAAYELAGHQGIRVVDTSRSIDDAIQIGQPIVTGDWRALIEAEQVDVIVEMTGTIDLAFEMTVAAMRAGKHVVSFNAELDATLGPYLQRFAREAGVRYTLGDGDQPGVTLNLYRQVKGMGFQPLVCGNNKGILDNYRTPETQKPLPRKQA